MGDFNIKVGNGWFPMDGTVQSVLIVMYLNIKKKIWPLSSKTDGLVAGWGALHIRWELIEKLKRCLNNTSCSPFVFDDCDFCNVWSLLSEGA
jgi:hypothetical protein